MFFEFNNKDYHLKPMMLNSEQELRFQGSYRFSGIKDYVTIVSNREWSKTAAKVA